MENFKFSKNKFHLSYVFWMALWGASYFLLEKNSFFILNIFLFILALLVDFFSEVSHSNSSKFDNSKFKESDYPSIENHTSNDEKMLIAK